MSHGLYYYAAVAGTATFAACLTSLMLHIREEAMSNDGLIAEIAYCMDPDEIVEYWILIWTYSSRHCATTSLTTVTSSTSI